MPTLDNTNELLRQATQLINQGDVKAARELLREAAQNDPQNADICYIASLAGGSVEQRTTLLERALKLNPQHQQARAALQQLRSKPAAPTPQPKKRAMFPLVVLGIGVIVLIGLLLFVLTRPDEGATSEQGGGKQKLVFFDHNVAYSIAPDELQETQLLEVHGIMTHPTSIDSAYFDTMMALNWSPDGRHLVMELPPYLYMLDAAGENDRWLATGHEPNWSPDGRKLVYRRHGAEANTNEIAVINADGSNAISLFVGEVSSPRWSPDGQHIAFLEDEQLYVMDDDGSNARLLNDQKVYRTHFAWSPDGQYIAFVRDEIPDTLIVVDINQSDPILEFPGAREFAWSPDGISLTYASNDSIFKVGLDGAPPVVMVAEAGRNPEILKWSPDGKYLAYKALEGIYVVGADGSNLSLVVDETRAPRNLLLRLLWLTPEQDRGIQAELAQRHYAEVNNDRFVLGWDDIYTVNNAPDSDELLIQKDSVPGNIISLNWSQDGSQTVMETAEGIERMNADGSNRSRLTDFGCKPVFSPSGSKIAFTAGVAPDLHQEDLEELYVMNADGSGVLRLSYLSARSIIVAWSPDEQQIAFVADRQLWMINSDGSQRHQLIDDDVVGRPAWSPDGTLVAFAQSEVRQAEKSAPILQENLQVIHPDGSGRTTVAAGFQPVWSPDGKQIAFLGNLEHPDVRLVVTEELYVVNSDGSNVRLLTDTFSEESDPQWSSDGKRIAYLAGGIIHLINADGSGRRRLPIEAAGPSLLWVPPLAPALTLPLVEPTLAAAPTLVAVAAPNEASPTPNLNLSPTASLPPSFTPLPSASPTASFTPTPSPTAIPARGAQDVLNILLVLDRSGSMAMDGTLPELANYLYPFFSYPQIRAGDRGGLITFNDTLKVDIPMTQIGEDREALRSAFITAFPPIANGGSILYEALVQGIAMVQEGSEDRPCFIILLTDGDDNLSTITKDNVLDAIGQAKAGGKDFYIFVIAYGVTNDIFALGQIADAGGTHILGAINGSEAYDALTQILDQMEQLAVQ